MRNWNWREFCVQVNLPSPIQQGGVRIQHAITPIQGLPNPIRQVVCLISLISLYPPHRSDLHPPSLWFSSTTLPSLQKIMLSHPSLSLHVMIMGWHRVQLSTSRASTNDYLSFLYSDDYELNSECSFSFLHASLQNRPPSVSSLWELKGKVTLSHYHGCKLTNWWKESPPGVPSIDRL